MAFPHRPVLLNECLQHFAPCELKVFVDGTLGAGGHAEALLAAHPEIVRYVGIDRDPEALEIASGRLDPWKEKLTLVRGDFVDLRRHLGDLGIEGVDGILLDLGVSSMQLDRAARGFSFSKEGPLDMRMNPDDPLTAADIVNEWSEEELGRIFREYGEERRWRAAARAIVETRQKRKIDSTQQLVEVIEPVLRQRLPRSKRKKIHPVTLVFQALRIVVNSELDVIKEVLPDAIDLLLPGGRLGVIAFHRLEDRLVKRAFQFAASDKYDTLGLAGMFKDKEPTVNLVTRKAVTSAEEEVDENPRCRSAKLRFAEKR